MRILLFFITLSLIVSACSNDDDVRHDPPITISPPYLQTGDSIGIVAISSRIVTDTTTCRKMIDIVRSWGLKVRLGKHLFDQHGGWFPASDKERAADLQEMIDNPNIRAVLFFRGGYGSVRTLDYLNLNKLRNSPKWLAGFSDLTVIHYAVHKIGVLSIHGAMPGSFIINDSIVDESALSLRDALFGYTTNYRIQPNSFNDYGQTTGTLIGGNLSLIDAVNGTNIDADLSRPSILFIEETGESISHVDRMMQTLRNSGKLKAVKGLIVGHFSGITNEADWGNTAYGLIKEYTKDLHIPVLFGFPAGHISPNYSLYMGRQVRLTVDESGGLLEFM